MKFHPKRVQQNWTRKPINSPDEKKNDRQIHWLFLIEQRHYPLPLIALTPLPAIPLGSPPLPPLPIWGPACGASDWALRTVSSTLSMRQVASVLASRQLRRTIVGSHTKDWKVSQMPSLTMSTPNHWPSTTSQFHSFEKIFIAINPN